MMILKNKYILIGALILITTFNQSLASSGFEREQADTVMIAAAKEANEQLAGMKVDEYTRLRFIGFDKNIPVYIYLYSTSIPVDKLNTKQKEDMDVFHINKTCGSSFRALMKKPYNMKVSHEFESIKTGKMIYKIVVGDTDCL